MAFSSHRTTIIVIYILGGNRRFVTIYIYIYCDQGAEGSIVSAWLEVPFSFTKLPGFLLEGLLVVHFEKCPCASSLWLSKYAWCRRLCAVPATNATVGCGAQKPTHESLEPLQSSQSVDSVYVPRSALVSSGDLARSPWRYALSSNVVLTHRRWSSGLIVFHHRRQIQIPCLPTILVVVSSSLSPSGLPHLT